MAVGYTRQSASQIVTGATIQASHFNNEYNRIQDAFDATTGHNHDGTVGGGAPINLTTAVTGTLPIAQGGTGVTDVASFKVAFDLEAGVDYQAYNATLAALAGLTLANNKGIYATGVSTLATYDLTATGRSLIGQSPSVDTFPYVSASNTISYVSITAAGRAILDDANNTAQRATLGLVIGTDVQAYDVDLAAIAGLTSAANKLPYFTGSGTAAVADFTATARSLVSQSPSVDTFPYVSSSNTITFGSITAAGRAILDDADAAAQRATLSAASKLIPPISKTSSFTLALTDLDQTIQANHASVAINITVPPNSSVAFPIGTEIPVCRYGAAATAFVAGVGVTIRSADGSLSIATQYGMAVLIKLATDEWLLAGNL